MELINRRYTQLIKALSNLYDALLILEATEKDHSSNKLYDQFTQEKIILNHRNGLIQCFEYSVELLWKYLKDYLEIILKKQIDIVGPAHIARACCNAKLISEKESEKCIEMVGHRNMTSHIYKEEIAEILRNKIPDYYELLIKIAERVKPE